MTTQNSAMGDEELEKAIREAIKAPLRSEVSTSDFVVMGISSTKLAEIVFDIKKALLARDQQIALAAQETERQYAWDLINAIRYGKTTLEKAKSETLERLSETQVEIDMLNIDRKQAQNKEK